jgi:hypothetical protein
MKTRARAVLLDEPASAEGGAKESRAAPLSLACPKTLLWRFTRALLRARPTRCVHGLPNKTMRYAHEPNACLSN